MKPTSLLLAGALPLALFACSAATDEGEPDDAQDELAVVTPCVLGTTCPADMLLLKDTSYTAERRAPARFRTDIVIGNTSGTQEATPRRFAQKTTRPMKLAPGRAVSFSGGAAADAPFQIDDFLLFEILETNGAPIAAGYVGPDFPMTLAGKPVKRLAGASWNTPVAGGSVDLTPLLPTDRAFVLRASALDFAGGAIVTEVHLHTSDAPPPPPPPPPVDPFDAASCAGAPITKAQAVARFAPGSSEAWLTTTTTVRTRVRTCNPVTGCGAWSAIDQVPYDYVYSHPQWGAMHQNKFLTIPTEGFASGARFFVQANNGALRLDFGLKYGNDGLAVNLGLVAHQDYEFLYHPTYAGTCNDAICSNASWRVYGGSVQQLLLNSLVTDHCFRFDGVRKVDTQEYETAILVTY
jgi:hypothetical protein